MTIDELAGRKVERVSEGGNLLANLALIDINTWETSQEVWQDWQDGANVEGVNTANLAVYRLENDEVVFELFGKEGNPFMDENLRVDAYNGILQNNFFFPQGAMKQQIIAVINAGASVTVRYSGLRLKTENSEKDYCYVKFDGNNNDEEKKLFNRIYGTDNINNGGTVYLLESNVVETQLRNRKEDLIVRACYFYSDNNFIAYVRGINYYNSAVRGVRRVDVAEGDAKRSSILSKLTTPDDIIEYLNTNPVTDERLAAILLKSANAFYQSKN